MQMRTIVRGLFIGQGRDEEADGVLSSGSYQCRAQNKVFSWQTIEALLGQIGDEAAICFLEYFCKSD